MSIHDVATYKGTILVDKDDRYWVVTADITEKKIVVTNERGDSFLINNTHAHGGRYCLGVNHVIYWSSNPVTRKGTYAFWLEAVETTDEYRAMIPLIAEAKELVRQKKVEKKAAEEAARIAKEEARARQLEMEEEACVNHSEHISVPGMWYCYVLSKTGTITGSRYFNPQYIREVTPMAKPNVYKLKLAGYHQVNSTQDWDRKEFGFSYVNVWTKFD